MAKVGAAATIKKKSTPIVQQPVQQPAPVQQAPVGISMAAPTVTATVGPVKTYNTPAGAGFAMTPQNTTAVVGPVQNVPVNTDDENKARALALASLQARAQSKAQAAYNRDLAKLNKQNSLADADKRRQQTEYRKQADYSSNKSLQNWMDTYRNYRDEGSWNENTRQALMEAYYPVYSNYKRYSSNGNLEDSLKELKSARTTLTGGQNLKDYFDNGSFTNNRYQNPDYITAFTARQAQLEGINGNPKASAMLMATNDEMQHWYNLKQQDDKDGTKTADKYLDDMYSTWETRYGQRNVSYEAGKLANEHPIIATIGSVVANSGPLGLYQAAENLVNAANGKDINPYSWGNANITSAGIMKETVANNIDNPLARLAYRAGTSAAESMAGAAMLGGLGKAGNVATKLSLAATAMTSRTNQELMKGTSQGMAVLQGAIDGGIEYVTETLGGIDKFLDKIRSGDTRLIINTLKQMASEGAEEGVGDIFRIGADAIIAGVNALRGDGFNLYSDEIYNYERYGYMSRDEAVKQVILDKIKEIGTDTLIGGVSGGMMGSAATAVNYNNLVSQGREATTNADGTLNMEAVQSLIERGQNMPANTLSHRQAELLQQKVNEGKAVTPREAAVLYANNVAAEKAVPGKQMREVYRAETDPAEWQAAKDEAMGHAAVLNPNVRDLYETAVEEAIDNGATGKQAIAEFDRAYTSGFNKLKVPQASYLSEETVKEVMDAGKAERKGTQASDLKTSAKANAEQILNKVNNYAENGSKVYQAAVREALDNGATAEQARVAFNEVYSNVYTNKPIPTNTSIPLSAPTIANIREAALKDRFAAENKARADAIPVNTNAGVAISDPVIRQHVEQGRLTETVDFADEMGKLFGEKVSLVAKLPQNGQINLRTGEIVVALNTDFGGIIDRDRAMRATLGHELAHRMRQVSPKTWDKFTQAVIGSDIDQFNADVNRMIKDTYKGDITRDAAQEEVLADYIGNRFFSGDIDTLRNMVESIDSLPQRSGFIQHIVDMASWIKSKLTGRQASNAQRIEDEFRKMFKETQAKVQQLETSEDISAEPEMKESIRSLSRAMNIEAVRDENGLITFSFDGEPLKGGDVTPDMVRETGIGALVSNSVTQGNITKADGEKQLKAFSDLMNSIINTQSPDMIWAFAGSEMFAALKSNSDPQYGTTVDFSTICRKTQDMITAMSAAMKEKGRGLTKDEIIELQGELNKAGRSVPCPVCYVFSRWAGVGNILDNIWNLQEKYKGYTTAELKQRADDIAARIKSMNLAQDKKGNPTVNNKALDAYRKARQEYKDSLNYELEKLETSKSQDDATQARMKEIREELPKVEEDINIVSEYSWVKNIASNPAYKPVPKEVLYDLDAGAEFAGSYPVVWKYRTTRGSGAGKAILPYSDMRLGDIILGPSNNSAMKITNSGGKVNVTQGNKLFDVVKGGEFNASQQKAYNAAVVRARKQNLIGGQRFQSTSDFRYEYALDYLMAFLELQSIGGKMQSYTKVPEFADMVNAVGGDVNLSVMPKGSGLDSNGELSFSNVTGMDINVAKKINSTFDNAQIILVGINDEHIRKAMDADYISFIIPWHALGASKDAYIANLIRNLGEKYDTSAYQSYEKVQEDHAYGSADMRDIRTQILTNVEGLSREQLNKITALAEQARPIGNRSFDELREIETKALAGDAEAMAEYRGWSAGLLLDLYHKMKNGSEAGNHLSKTQAKNVMPHEYWDKSANVDRAYVNGFIFRSYCQNLGLHPRFTGWAGSSRVNYGDFSDSEGYWKTLIDRPMYDNNGHYREQQKVNVTNLNSEMLTPDYAKAVYREYRPIEPNAAEAARIGTEYASEIKYSRKSSAVDSEGRTLTEEQAKFFADSKARDADGNLLVLYHGTDSAGFNTFRNEIWMTTSRKDAGSYGAATRTYDPNEQRVDVATKGGNFTIGSSLRFDTEQDRADFLKEYPEAVNYLTPREMMAAQRTADEEEDYDRYDALVDQEKTDEKIRRAYSRYEDLHSETIPLKELVDNKDQYTVDDFKRALLSIDRNAYFDDEYDNYETDEEFRDAIAEVLEESFLNEDESYNDFPVRVRIPAGKSSTASDVTHIHNRIYEMYANVTHPYTYDAKGRGSEGNGAYYAAVQKALDSNEYDGAIINNIRVGRYQELGTVVVAKDSSQVKLVNNETPTENPDIRYSKRTESDKNATIRRRDATIDRLRHEMTLTHGVEPDAKAVAKAAAELAGNWKVPVNAIKAAFTDIALEYAKYRRLTNQNAAAKYIQASEQRFSEMCEELAANVAKSAKVGTVEEIKSEIMDAVFNAPVSEPTFADKLRERTASPYEKRLTRAAESKERTRLLNIMRRLDKLANKSSAQHRAEINEAIGEFDLVAKGITKRTEMKLSGLEDWVNENKENPDAIITPQMLKKIERIYKAKRISEITIGEVREATRSLLELENNIRTENRVIGRNERRTTSELGEQAIKGIHEAKGVGSSSLSRGMDKFLINGLMRPETEILRLVGFDKNNPLYEYMFGDELSILTGQMDSQDYQRQAHEDYFRKFLDDKAFMETITGKKARAIEITGTGKDGLPHTVKVTSDFLMAMYMHSRNEQNLMHICEYPDADGVIHKPGGMKVPDYDLYRKGKRTEAYNEGMLLTFTRSQFENQLKGLSDKEMRFIQAAQKYYSEFSKPRINDVSEQLVGYPLAEVDNYFRIQTDSDFRGGEFEALKFDGSLESMGWTKERTNSSMPIRLIPLSEQLQKDIVDHSKYVGLAIPIRNFSKIYGISEHTYKKNDQGVWELQTPFASSVINEINRKHPSGADTNYIRDLLVDLQNPVSNMTALDRIFAGLRSKYAGSVLTFNLGVALKQAASFPTAAAEIGWTPIIKTIPNFAKAMAGFAKPTNQKTIDFICKYSPLMRLRTEGMSTQELADMQRLNHKVPSFLNWIQNVDVNTVAALWKSAEFYVKQNFKDLKPGSEEFYKKVGEVHTRIITKTQPNYSELQRPGLLRSKSEITKTLMMFKTQPFQNFNILYEAVGAYKAAERNYAKDASAENKATRDEARKRLAWAISSQVVSNAVFAAMQVAWDLLRRKEDPLDDEDKAVQRLNNWFKNMISSWAGMVPGGTQALEVVQKWVDDALVAMGREKYFDGKVYGFELDASIEGLNKMVDLITNLPNLGGDIFGLISGDESKEDNFRGLFNQFKDISSFLGLPANNVTNLAQATTEWVMRMGLGYSDAQAKYEADRFFNGVYRQGSNNGVSSKYSKAHYADLAIAAGEETMQKFREDDAFETPTKTASKYLDERILDQKKDAFEKEYGNKTREIYVDGADSVNQMAFQQFVNKYMENADGTKSQGEIAAALEQTDLSEEERKAIYNLYKDANNWKTDYDGAVAKAEPETSTETGPIKEPPVASAAEPRTAAGQQGIFTSLTTPGVNALMPAGVSKSAKEITTPPEIWMDVPAEMQEAYRMFAESYSAGSDGDGKLSQSEVIHALGDVDEANREALYNLLADGKWNRSYHDAKVTVEKDDMQQTYGTNEMYLETSPLEGDRLDEFNRAYAAVSNNNSSVTQAELAAALNSMNVSLEEGEAIWAAYAQDHADKYGSAWKKTYASYYGGGSGGSSGGSKSSGGGGGRSSGGGGSRSSGGSTQPVVGPYPGYSENPAAAYTQPAAQSVQPVAMPQPVATAPQTPYTGLQRHSEGGNVNLTYRPILRAVELRRKGWGGVLSDTVRNFVKSYAGNGKALNFTPIVVDENGEYVRTLSPNELREYAEAVLKGEREDDLKLQVGTAYEGADAMAQAEKAAAEIEQLDKDYTQTA